MAISLLSEQKLPENKNGRIKLVKHNSEEPSNTRNKLQKTSKIIIITP